MKNLLIGALSALYVFCLGFVYTSIAARAGYIRAGLLMIDPNLQPYLEMFQLEAKNQNYPLQIPDLVVMFGPTRSEEAPMRIGYCANTWPRTIVIDRESFEAMSLPYREMLMFHEFGHCLLNRPHDIECRIEEYPCTTPRSIMYPNISAKDYLENRAYYMKELFTNY